MKFINVNQEQDISMKHLLSKTRLQHLIQYRNGYLALASGSIILNILLSFVIIKVAGDVKVIELPPSIDKTFWVASNHVSSEYLSEMALFFVYLRFDVTPSNVETQRNLLLHYVAQNNYAALKEELISEEDHIRKAHITTSFYPSDILVDSDKLIARVPGDLHSTVGETSLPLQRVTYEVKFSYHSGRLFVESFDEVKSHA
jgi:conjugal transfer pilus assembly protein TraE